MHLCEHYGTKFAIPGKTIEVSDPNSARESAPELCAHPDLAPIPTASIPVHHAIATVVSSSPCNLPQKTALHTVLAEPSFLARVATAQGDPTNGKMVKFQRNGKWLTP